MALRERQRSLSPVDPLAAAIVGAGLCPSGGVAAAVDRLMVAAADGGGERVTAA